jgi:GxxExxY protein
MCQELTLKGLRYERELALPVSYRGHLVEAGYRLDLLVEDAVVVELKATSRITGVHQAQLLSYLRLSKRSLGLLINFHVNELRHGITRMVNSFRG